MLRQMSFLKTVGMIVMAFGCGVMLAFFLPTYFLAVIEAAVIIAAGLFYILQKHW